MGGTARAEAKAAVGIEHLSGSGAQPAALAGKGAPHPLDPQELVRIGHLHALGGRPGEARVAWLDATFQFMLQHSWSKASATCRIVLQRWPRDQHTERLLRAIELARTAPVARPVDSRERDPIAIDFIDCEPMERVLES